MILFISNSGESLPIAWRLKKEGVDCQVYIHSPDCRRDYDGILEKVPIAELRKKAFKADMVIFDITRPNRKEKQDIAVLKMFGVKTGNDYVFGPVADKLKKHVKVIGSSTFTEEIEMDRKKGSDLAKKIGLQIPEAHEFKNIEEGKAFLKGKHDLWVLKPFGNQALDLTYVEKYSGELLAKMEGELPSRLESDKFEFILQKVIDGVEIDIEGWFDGKDFVHFNHTLERKRLMNGDLGPAIGSQNNTVWIKRKGNFLLDEMKKMTPFLKEANYIGPIDFNCIVSEEDHKPYFLEFTPRFGYDALFCLLSLVRGPLKNFFLKDFKVDFQNGYVSSSRITIPPYPYLGKDLLEDFAKDVPIEGKIDDFPYFWMEDVYKNGNGLACAGSDGVLGVVTGRGESLGESIGNVYRNIDRLKIGSYMQFRTDVGKKARRSIETLNEWGIEVN